MSGEKLKHRSITYYNMRRWSETLGMRGETRSPAPGAIKDQRTRPEALRGIKGGACQTPIGWVKHHGKAVMPTGVTPDPTACPTPVSVVP